MKLYVGGVCQGQEELARIENPDSRIILNFHEIIKDLTREGGDARQYARELCQTKPDAVVVSDEIGSGIVPIDPFERKWRENTGRALCVIASFSKEVTRVVCGVGVKIKK